MQRREALGLLGCLAFLPALDDANAQTRSTVRRVGVIATGELASLQRALDEQADAFRKLGWAPGKNLVFELRSGSSSRAYKKDADDLVRLKVDVIVADGVDATRAAMLATSTTPIVFSGSRGDPVRLGFVSSLARPGGNVTGVVLLDEELVVKRVELLRELLPHVRTIGVLGPRRVPKDRVADEQLYASLGIRPLFFDVETAADYEVAIRQAAHQGAEAALISGIYFPNGPAIAAAAIGNRLATIAEDPKLVDAGILASVASDLAEQFDLLAYFVDSILRGAKPSDLPVRQPTRFETCINATTAGALGIPISQRLRLGPTRII